MPTRRVMKSALYGFLGTLSIRYADHEGYWLYGFAVECIDRRTVNLIAPDKLIMDPSPAVVFDSLARLKFREQVEASGLPFRAVCSAELDLFRSQEARLAVCGSGKRHGFDLTLHARAQMDNGFTCDLSTTIFAAPHDPSLELRSGRATAGRLDHQP